MEQVEFLRRVLPSKGWYCLAEFDTEQKQHEYVKTIDGLLQWSAKHDANKINSYFGLVSFAKEGSRKAPNATHMRALFIDVDSGRGEKTYGTKKEAYLGIRKFLNDTDLISLGTPIIVDSGGGVHLYWPMERDIPIDEWRPAARNLKRLCAEYGLKIDDSVTADAARVLRVPGSHNFNYVNEKNPEPLLCEIKINEGITFNFETVAAAIKQKLKGPPATKEISIPGTAPKKKETSFKLTEGTNNKFKLLLDKSMQGAGCDQLKYYIEHASDDGMEPLWRGLLSWSMKCEDADEYNKHLSDLHPYDEERMHTKLREIKGPYPCTKMQELNEGGCDKCKHYGKITNPLVLARYIKTDETKKEVVLEKQAPVEKPKTTITRPAAPKGYSYAQGGGVIMHQKSAKKSEDGEELVKDIRLLDYDLFVVHILNINRTHTVYMVADKKTGPETIVFPQRAIVSKDETLKALAEQNIMALFGSGNDVNLYSYIRAAVEEASRTHNALIVPSNYGWQEDGSIVCHERIYHPDGSITSFPMPSLDAMNKKFKLRGSSMEPWLNIVNMLISREEWMLLGFGLVGAASLLMKYAGVNGVVFHACGKTGAGKSLALSLSGGMFGHPSMIGIASSSSEIALIEAASELNSFGVLMDESTTQQDKQPVGNSKIIAAQRNAWAKSVIYRMSEGTPKDRSTTKGGLQVGRGGWKSLLLTTSNSYLMDSLVSQDNSSEAVIMRLLEAGFYTEMTLTEQEQENLSALREHHGHVGEKYIRWLVQNDALSAPLFKDCRKRLTELLGYKGSERFWFDGGASILCASIILGSKYSNIIDIPVKKIIDYCIVPLIENGRKYVGLSQKDADDVLSSYTRERYGQLVVVRRSEASKMLEAVLGHGALIDETISRSNIAGRVEHDVTPGRIDYYIEIKLLRQHCSAVGYSFEEFKKEMERKYHVEYLKKKDLLAKTKGPEMRVAAMRISKPDSSLEETGD